MAFLALSVTALRLAGARRTDYADPSSRHVAARRRKLSRSVLVPADEPGATLPEMSFNRRFEIASIYQGLSTHIWSDGAARSKSFSARMTSRRNRGTIRIRQPGTSGRGVGRLRRRARAPDRLLRPACYRGGEESH